MQNVVQIIEAVLRIENEVANLKSILRDTNNTRELYVQALTKDLEAKGCVFGEVK